VAFSSKNTKLPEGGQTDKFELGGLLAGIISIFFGIVVIVWPRALAYAIGIYLILFGTITVVAALP
jgi:uncharacterized membrane protein HdeD (DUF308 family)